MKNERMTTPDFLSVPVPTGTKAGDVVNVYGSLPGVASTDEGAGGNIAGRASVEFRGVFDVWTTDAVSAEGTKLYVTGNGTAAGTLTTTPTSNTFVGVTVADASGAGATKASGGSATAGPFVHLRLAKV